MNPIAGMTYTVFRVPDQSIYDLLARIERFMLDAESSKRYRNYITGGGKDYSGHAHFHTIPPVVKDPFDRIDQSFVFQLIEGHEEDIMSFIICDKDNGINPEKVSECILSLPVSVDPGMKTKETMEAPIPWLEFIRRAYKYLEAEEAKIYDEHLWFSFANFDSVPKKGIFAPYVALLSCEGDREEKWASFCEPYDKWRDERESFQRSLGYTVGEIFGDYRD